MRDDEIIQHVYDALELWFSIYDITVSKMGNQIFLSGVDQEWIMACEEVAPPTQTQER